MTSNYLRLYRSQPNYRWWRPLLAVALAATLIISVSSLFSLLTVVGFTVVNGVAPTPAEAEALFVPNVTNPFGLLLALISVAVWIPLIFFSLWAVGLKPAGMLNSVTFRLRWRQLGRYLGAAAVVTVLVQAIQVTLAFLSGEGSTQLFTLDPGTIALSVLVIVLVVPFQAAAEEYAFRGIFMQTLGSWMKTPVIPIVLPTVVFMFAHQYDIWGLLEVFSIGVAAAWLTYKTGGLEAAIAIHVLNNVSIFLLLLSGALGTTAVSADSGSPLSLAVTVFMLVAYVAWVLRLHRNSQEQTTTDEHAVPPEQAQPPLVASDDLA